MPCRYKGKYEDRVRRQLLIVNPKMPEEEVQRLVFSGFIFCFVFVVVDSCASGPVGSLRAAKLQLPHWLTRVR